MIDGRNNLETCSKIDKITTGWGDDYTSSCLLDCLFQKL